MGPLDLAVFNAGTHQAVSVETFDPAPFRRLTVADLSDERRPGCYWPLTDPE